MQDRFLEAARRPAEQPGPDEPTDSSMNDHRIAQINTVTGLQTLNLTMQTMAEQFSTMQQIQGDFADRPLGAVRGRPHEPGRQDRQVLPCY